MKNYLRMKMIVFLFGILSFSTNWVQDHSLNFDGIKDYVQWGDPEQESPGFYSVTSIIAPLVGSDF